MHFKRKVIVFSSSWRFLLNLSNESAHKERVDTNLFDFERFAAEALTIWENKSYRNGKGIDDGPALIRDFRRIFPSETVPEDIFILEAREKVKLLKRRMTRPSSRD